MVIFPFLGILSFVFIFKCKYCYSRKNASDTSRNVQDLYKSRLVGGMPAFPEKYPHNVVIFRLNFGDVCGGSIISKKWIISSAGCHSGGMAIFVGTNWVSGGDRYDVKKSYLHPNWASKAPHFDFMLIELRQDIVFGQYVQPINLSWKMMDIVNNKFGYLPGVGKPYESYAGKYYTMLREIKLPIVDFEVCKAAYSTGGTHLGREYIYTTENIKDRDAFCAGYAEAGIGMCTGDAGSGFIVGGKLVGIASRSIGCGRPRTPNIFSAVPFVRDWICEVTGV